MKNSNQSFPKKTVKIKVYLDGDYYKTVSVTSRADSNFWNVCRERIENRFGGDNNFEVNFSAASLTASITEKF